MFVEKRLKINKKDRPLIKDTYLSYTPDVQL